MKRIYKLLITLLLFCFGYFTLFAQDNIQISDLIKQGVGLHNQGKYAEAIDKYNEALKIDPENFYANYQVAFSLYAAKKPNDAIPHLEKAVNSPSASISMASYVLLATIYDEGKQSKKAIETYDKAIKINPDYPQIFYNKGLAYFRNQQYAEAETSAIEAMKHDPKNASSQRLYALVCFHQKKLGVALLGFCSFLLLEPTGPRAAEAFGNIQHIIAAGVHATNNNAISTAPDGLNEGLLNFALSSVISAGQYKKLQGQELLQFQLEKMFTVAKQFTHKNTNSTFVESFFVDYLYKLGESGNTAAFTRMASLSAYKSENTKWLNDNPDKVAALKDWVAKTERGF